MKRNLNVTAAVIVREGKVLLGFRQRTHSGYWYTPGGRVEEGEDIVDGLLREIREEIGCEDVRIHSKLGEYPGALDDEHGADILHAYIVEIGEEPILMEPEKFAEWRWFGLDELPERMIRPERDREMFTEAISWMSRERRG